MLACVESRIVQSKPQARSPRASSTGEARSFSTINVFGPKIISSPPASCRSSTYISLDKSTLGKPSRELLRTITNMSAEELKAEGNKLFAAKDFQGAA